MEVIREEWDLDRIGLGTSFLIEFQTKSDQPALSTLRVTLPAGYSTE